MKRGTVTVGYLHPGIWSACFGLSYRDLCLYDLGSRQRIIHAGMKELQFPCGSGQIVAARNEVTRCFLDETDSEWLWFIDSDMGFSADTVDRLVDAADEHKRPVVGGLCFAQKADPAGHGEFHARRYVITPTVYQWLEQPDGDVGIVPIERYERDALQVVGATGAACILIHRRVLNKIRAKYGDVWWDEITHPTGKAGKPRKFSEDISFCIRVAGVDEPVHVDTRVKTCHEKDGIYLDEYAYDRERTLAHLEQQATEEEAAHV